MGTHAKKVFTIPVGGSVASGSRTVRLDAVNGDIADVTITRLRGEGIEVRDPKQRDMPWIHDDPGEGEMVQETRDLAVGHKLRVGAHRQFRILSVDGANVEVAVVGPAAELQ